MVLLVVGLVAVFVVLPWLIGSMLWSMIGWRPPILFRLMVTGVIAWMLWGHFQLPQSETGGCEYLRRRSVIPGEVSQAELDHLCGPGFITTPSLPAGGTTDLRGREGEREPGRPQIRRM